MRRVLNVASPVQMQGQDTERNIDVDVPGKSTVVQRVRFRVGEYNSD